MSFLPINNTHPASVPDAHAVRPAPDQASDHAERLQRQVRYRALAKDELAYAREARALGGAHAEHGLPNGVRRARTYWRMMLSERRRAIRFETYEAGRQARDAVLAAAPTPWDDLPAAGEIIEALRHGPMRTFALDTAVVIEGLSFSGRVVLRMGAQVWSLTTIDAAVIAILLRLQPDLRIAPLVADALSLGSRQAEQKVESVHRWSAVIQPVDGDEA